MHALSVDLADAFLSGARPGRGPGTRSRFIRGESSGDRDPGGDRGGELGRGRGPRRDVADLRIPDGEDAKTLVTVEAVARGSAPRPNAGPTSSLPSAVASSPAMPRMRRRQPYHHRGTAINTWPPRSWARSAAIGGKTGVNLPEGKNLVGAFWQPRGAEHGRRSRPACLPVGLQSAAEEIAKYAFLGDAPSADQPIEEQVKRCTGIKAAVVGEDELEGGRRTILLNYGHTLAHALEGAALVDHPDWDLRHGEAVAVGILFARAAGERGWGASCDEARVAEHRRIVGTFDLPTDLPAGARARGELVAFMGRTRRPSRT